MAGAEGSTEYLVSVDPMSRPDSTHPPRPLTFGLELEFLVGYIDEGKSVPKAWTYPEWEAQQEQRGPLVTVPENECGPVWVLSRMKDLLHENKIPVQNHKTEEWKDWTPQPPLDIRIPFTRKSTDEYAIVEWSKTQRELLGWVVSRDGSVKEPDATEDYAWVDVELKSPPLFDCKESFDQVERLIGVIRSNFRTRVNPTCGLHIHVGNGRYPIPFSGLKYLAQFLWAADPTISRLYPAERRINMHTLSIREHSILAKEAKLYLGLNDDIGSNLEIPGVAIDSTPEAEQDGLDPWDRFIRHRTNYGTRPGAATDDSSAPGDRRSRSIGEEINLALDAGYESDEDDHALTDDELEEKHSKWAGFSDERKAEHEREIKDFENLPRTELAATFRRSVMSDYEWRRYQRQMTRIVTLAKREARQTIADLTDRQIVLAAQLRQHVAKGNDLTYQQERRLSRVDKILDKKFAGSPVQAEMLEITEDDILEAQAYRANHYYGDRVTVEQRAKVAQMDRILQLWWVAHPEARTPLDRNRMSESPYAELENRSVGAHEHRRALQHAPFSSCQRRERTARCKADLCRQGRQRDLQGSGHPEIDADAPPAPTPTDPKPHKHPRLPAHRADPRRDPAALRRAAHYHFLADAPDATSTDRALRTATYRAGQAALARARNSAQLAHWLRGTTGTGTAEDRHPPRLNYNLAGHGQAALRAPRARHTVEFREAAGTLDAARVVFAARLWTTLVRTCVEAGGGGRSGGAAAARLRGIEERCARACVVPDVVRDVEVEAWREEEFERLREAFVAHGAGRGLGPAEAAELWRAEREARAYDCVDLVADLWVPGGLPARLEELIRSGEWYAEEGDICGGADETEAKPKRDDASFAAFW